MQKDDEGVPRITCYREAKQHYDKQDFWRNKQEKPVGFSRYYNRRMRELDDGTIVIAYNKQDVIWYHPDNTVSMCAYKKTSWYGFITQVTPCGLMSNKGTNRSGPVIYFAKETVDQRSRGWHMMWELVKSPEFPYGRYRRRTGVQIVRASVPVRFKKHPKHGWWPIDEAQLEPFEWHEVPKRGRQKINEAAGIHDLKACTDAIMKLHELPPSTGNGTPRQVLDLIKKGEFGEAIALSPRCTSWEYSPQTGYRRGPEKIPGSFITKLRSLAYQDAGTTTFNSKAIVTQQEFARIDYCMKRFG